MKRLGVATYAEKALNVESLTSWGQSENLTDRLRTLLNGYKDGLSIFRETIQNADDAGATVVKYCYDMRNNTKWRNPRKLIDSGMVNAQGPALIVYNNSTFAEDDFVNIIRLGSMSKRDLADKVGKFGLGFNVVYNLTDIPSILSGSSLVFLDPNVSFMPNRIKNPSSPGIRLNFSSAEQNVKSFQFWHDQFKTYENVFGCDIFEPGFKCFDGTIIRLPLRNQESAISDNIYNSRNQMVKLFEIVLENADSLLLFTQSVQTVEFYVLEDDKSEMELLFKIEKSLCEDAGQVKHNVDLGERFANKNELCKQSSLLKAASTLVESKK